MHSIGASSAQMTEGALPGVHQQQRQDRPAAAGEAQRQQVQHRPAVGHRPVIVEEEAEPAEEVVELGAAQALLRPGHLALEQAQGLSTNDREAPLEEARSKAAL